MFISPPEKTYRQTLVHRLLLFIPVALVLLIAFAVVDFDTSKMSPVGWAIVAVTLGLYIFAWWAIGQSSLNFHSEGVSTTGAFGGKEVRWDEISETFFYKVDQNLIVHFGLIGLLMAAASSRQASGDPMGAGQMSLKFSGRDPKQKIAITSSWRNAPEAVKAVLNKVNPQIKPEIQRKVQGGETVMFGPVTLSRQGIGYKQKPQVSFAEVTIKFNGTYLAVKKEGKWLNVFRAPAQKIPNVFVLLDLAEELKLGGAPRPPDPFLHMAR
jgi:hypothetical protein